MSDEENEVFEYLNEMSIVHQSIADARGDIEYIRKSINQQRGKKIPDEKIWLNHMRYVADIPSTQRLMELLITAIMDKDK